MNFAIIKLKPNSLQLFTILFAAPSGRGGSCNTLGGGPAAMAAQLFTTLKHIDTPLTVLEQAGPYGALPDTKDFHVHCFLFVGKRFQPSRHSQSSKGQIQTVTN